MMEGNRIDPGGITLKSCPFCGAEARFIFYDPFDGYQGNLGRYFVACTWCGCETPRSFKTKERAAETWNRRFNDNPHVGD